MFLSACGLLPTVDPLPTLIPEDHIPTAIALTAEALIAEGGAPPTAVENQAGERDQSSSSGTGQQAQDSQPTVTPTSVQPAPSPTLTVTPAAPSPTPTYALKNPAEITLPAEIPYGQIQILNPGPFSKVASPIKLHAYLTPGADDRVRVALYGEDGRLLVRHLLNYSAPPSYKVHLKLDLTFEIPGVAETGRIEITTRDDYGRELALASTDVVLLSEGASSVNPPADLYERIVIQHPVPSALIQGGEVIVQGFTRTAPEGELLVQLVDFRDEVIGAKVIGVAEQELDEGYRFFVGEVPYQLGTPSWIRVQVIARDGVMSGLQHLSSVRVLLSP